MLRLLANEIIGGPLVRRLRASGHDVAWMREIGPIAREDHKIGVVYT